MPFAPGAAGAREDRQVVGDGAAGDVHLLAVEDVVVAVADGARLEVGGVGAVVGLGQAEGALDLAGGDALAGHFCCCSSAADHDRRDGQAGEQEHEAGAASYFATSSMARQSGKMPSPVPPYCLGDGHAE